MLDKLAGERFGVSLEDASRLIELLPKLAVVWLAFTYVAGFAIINFHLRRYGLFSAGLIKSEYIMAGFTWCVFLFIAYVAVVDLWDDVRRARAHAKSRRWLRAVLRVAFGIWYAVYLPVFAMRSFGARMEWSDVRLWAAEVVILFTPIALGVMREISKSAWREWIGAGHTLSQRSRWELAQLVGLVVTVLSSYAWAVYPWIPPIFGGGQPTSVRLEFSQGAADTNRLIHEILGPGPSYALIAESPEWIVLGEPQGKPSETPWAAKASNPCSSIRSQGDS